MSAESEGRTEAPTGKRQHEARQEGRIPKSAELVQWISLYVSLTIVKSTVVKGGRYLTELMHQSQDLMAKPDPATAMHFMGTSILGGFKVIAPLMLIYAGIGIIGHFAQVRFVLATKALKPNFKRLNPIPGIKNLFSKNNYFNAGKQLIKTALLGYVAYRSLWAAMTHLSQNAYPTNTIITYTSGLAIDFVRQVAIIGIVLGFVDYFHQRKTVGDGLKMTKADVKQENRSQEGSPEVKNKIRQKQFAMSRNRMMSAIKDADVLVVNPVHVAVALKYDPATGAPRVVAKGVGHVAEKIREKAEEAGIPMIQDIPLARTLNRICNIDDEIPSELFEAVAKLLAFVFALRNRGGVSSGVTRMPGTPDLEEYERTAAKTGAEDRFGIREAQQRLADLS